VATKKETIKTMSDTQLEPTAPTVSFVKYAGDISGQTADHSAWLKDIEERKARSAAFEAKRQQLKSEAPKLEVGHIDAALNALHDADEDFTQSFGKPNTELLTQRQLVAELTVRLSEEQAKLDAIEARGDSVDRLNAAVQVVESQFQAMLSRAENAEIRRLAIDLYGWDVPFDQLSSERKREFRLHSSIIELKKLYLPQHPHKTDDVAVLQRRLSLVGERLVALREHAS
jgi:hypothetical protein